MQTNYTYCFSGFPPHLYDSTHLIRAYKQFIKLQKVCLFDVNKQLVLMGLVLILKRLYNKWCFILRAKDLIIQDQED